MKAIPCSKRSFRKMIQKRIKAIVEPGVNVYVKHGPSSLCCFTFQVFIYRKERTNEFYLDVYGLPEYIGKLGINNFILDALNFLSTDYLNKKARAKKFAIEFIKNNYEQSVKHE